MKVVGKIKKIEMPSVSDLIIRQILSLLEDGSLKPGDQLPSEVILQKAFGVAKQQLKIAFKKLELYGVLETRPQSGSYIPDIDTKILIGLITNILNIGEGFDVLSLEDTRAILEVRAVELAAARISDKDLASIIHANEIFFTRSKKVHRAIEDDIFFHLEIVRHSKSSTLIALYSFITRQLIEVWNQMDLFEEERTRRQLEHTFGEHRQIIEKLSQRDVEGSSKAMRAHMDSVYAESLYLSKLLEAR